MKLLFDQNVAPKLVGRLSDLFPGSGHVQPIGLDYADDNQIWKYARLNGFVIVTKDADYYPGTEDPHTSPKRKRGIPRLRFGLV